MPTYITNPVKTSGALASGLSNLGDIIAGGAEKRFNAEIAARKAAASIGSAHASAAHSYASAGAASALEAQRQQDVDLRSTIASSVVSPQSRDGMNQVRKIVQSAMAAGLSIDAVPAMMKAAGYPDEMVSSFVSAIGKDYGNTITGFGIEAQNTKDAARLKAEQDATAARLAAERDLEAQRAKIAQQGVLDAKATALAEVFTAEQNDLDRIHAANINDADNAQSGANNAANNAQSGDNNAADNALALEIAQDKATALAAVNAQKAQDAANKDLVAVIGPDGVPVLVTRADAAASGLRPVLSETDAKGLGLQTGENPNTGMYYGTSMDAQNGNIIDEVVALYRQGRPISAGQAQRYALAMAHAFPVQEQVDKTTGNLITLRPQLPAGIPTVESVLGVANGGPITPTMPADPIVPTTPGEVVPAPEGIIPAPAAVTSDPSRVDVLKIDALAPDEGSDTFTATEMRSMDLNSAIIYGVKQVNELVGYNPATGAFSDDGFDLGFAEAFQESAGNALINQLGEGGLGAYFQNAVMSDDLSVYKTLQFMTIEPLLRLRSGAATPEEEVRRYQQYFPQPGDSPRKRALKMASLNRLARAALLVAERTGTPLAEMAGIIGTDFNVQTEEGRAFNAQIQAAEIELARTDPPLTEPREGPAGGSPLILKMNLKGSL